VERCLGRLQTVVTAGIAPRQLREGSDLQIQVPSVSKEAETYLQATGQTSSGQLEQARPRLLVLLHPLEHRLADQKRTEIVVAMGAQ
jgi:ElaB/YqjD/DUF883 family membrane-anchored ribosome-binding protein